MDWARGVGAGSSEPACVGRPRGGGGGGARAACLAAAAWEALPRIPLPALSLPAWLRTQLIVLRKKGSPCAGMCHACPYLARHAAQTSAAHHEPWLPGAAPPVEPHPFSQSSIQPFNHYSLITHPLTHSSMHLPTQRRRGTAKACRETRRPGVVGQANPPWRQRAAELESKGQCQHSLGFRTCGSSH